MRHEIKIIHEEGKLEIFYEPDPIPNIAVLGIIDLFREFLLRDMVGSMGKEDK